MTVEVFRDAWGVPHVRADDELGLAYGQGLVTAVDRAWQVEVDLWRAEGRLAERIGPAGIDWDVLARRLRIAHTARRVHDALPDDDRAWLAAYVRGIDDGLRGRPVAEVEALDAHLGGSTPREPWPAWGPVGVLLVAHVLFSTFPRLLWNDHVARALGDDAVGLFDAAGGAGDPGSGGSNAWALHGSRTASGLPLVAGDPHRLLELPGVYQQVRLACPGVDVVGLAFPGVPGVPHVAHTGDVAWGVTNAMAHHVEVFRERLRRSSDGWQARGPDGWEPATVHEETVRVRGGEDVPVLVGETARGPVLWQGGTDDRPAPRDDETSSQEGASDDGPARVAVRAPRDATSGGSGRGAATGDEPVERDAWSVRFPVRATADAGVGCLRRLLHVRTAAQVADVLRDWVDPVNRVLVADRRGVVLRVVAGRVPDRDAGLRHRPHDAWSDAGRPPRWVSPVDPEPVADVAVDANERPARPDQDLGALYAPPQRARRIRTLLDATRDEPANAASTARVHGDVRHDGAARLLAHLPPADVDVSAAAVDLSADARRLRDRLLAWDREMAADSRSAADFARWRSALVRRVAAHPSLAALHDDAGAGPVLAPWFVVPARVADALPALLDADRADPDRLRLDGPALVRAALEDVVAEAHGDGAPADAPAWADLHRLHPLHVLDEVPGCASPFRVDAGVGGDTECVRSTSSTPGVTHRSWRVSVARYVWDLADRERSRWNVPFGASGVPGDPHALDQLDAWLDARTTEVVTDWDRLHREDLP
ncbi:penicillin acylase family protein [Cellulomonas sp. H30R-01]|uniref:penicillin acylase family protein n=1 Tax=Cellulomonas sp. H30R-01 TaxID=2704467 RepID=UPI00138C5039|nr:penicillin acylase family protein [Cellulomonas sp. H30R-01]QHT54756.1 penicillin acylase family protein [Cellulomonas sp. H30R-01]